MFDFLNCISSFAANQVHHCSLRLLELHLSDYCTMYSSSRCSFHAKICFLNSTLPFLCLWIQLTYLTFMNPADDLLTTSAKYVMLACLLTGLRKNYMYATDFHQIRCKCHRACGLRKNFSVAHVEFGGNMDCITLGLGFFNKSMWSLLNVFFLNPLVLSI